VVIRKRYFWPNKNWDNRFRPFYRVETQDQDWLQKQKTSAIWQMGYCLNRVDESIFRRHLEFLILAHCHKPLSIFNNAFDRNRIVPNAATTTFPALKASNGPGKIKTPLQLVLKRRF
jgi:hypothetical protein